MKTEGLTLVEAWRALLDGKCVRSCQNYMYTVREGFLNTLYCNEWKRCEPDFGLYGHGPFYIVPDPSKPKPKSLSFDEACEALREDKSLTVKEFTNGGDYFTWYIPKSNMQSINLLDLAERRGWLITLAE